MSQNRTTKSLSPSEYERIGRIAVEFGERIDPSSGDGPFIRVPMIDVDLVRGSVSEVGKGGAGRSKSFTDLGNSEFQPGDRVRVKAGASRDVSSVHVGKTFVVVKLARDDYSRRWVEVDTDQGPWAFADYLLEKVECVRIITPTETVPQPVRTPTFTHCIVMPVSGEEWTKDTIEAIQARLKRWLAEGGSIVFSKPAQVIFGDYLPYAAESKDKQRFYPGDIVRIRDCVGVLPDHRGRRARVVSVDYTHQEHVLVRVVVERDDGFSQDWVFSDNAIEPIAKG